jgi:hypothetical protein
MADTKISALTASTTPLAGTEVLPIVQSGVTKQVSVTNLTAGRAISATELTLTTGNLIVANGQGIDFSATPGAPGATSELLNDYEEGTWTPVLTFGGGGGVSGTFTGKYTKIGRAVNFSAYLELSATGASTGAASISGLPFASSVVAGYSYYLQNLTYTGTPLFSTDATTSSINVRQITALGAVTNLSNSNFANNTLVVITGSYVI